MTRVATTPCPICGNPVLAIDDRLYDPAINGALHGCTAPEADVPTAEGEPMVFDEATGQLVPMEQQA